MNVLDRIVSVISPKAGLSREKYRMALTQLRKYDAAAKGRRTDGWHSTGSSANTELLRSLPYLRNRSRELTRNNVYAKRAISIISRNIIGTGIRPKSALTNVDEAKKVMDLFNEWANDKDKCDFDGFRTFYGIQRLASRCIAESGGVLIRKRYVNDKNFPLRLQVLEPDFIDLNKDLSMGKDADYIIQGVQFDKTGRRTGYWCFDRHPGDYHGGNLISAFVPNEDILYAFNIERPGQVHGVPEGVSTMLKLHDLDDYEDAQLVRQKIAACFAVFVTDSTELISTSGTTTANNGDLSERVEPGIIQRLGPGKEVTFASPPGAGGYNEYVSTVLRGVAIGYNISYEALTGDLSQANFSANRMGWIESQRYFTDVQVDTMIPGICDPVWVWFMNSMKIAKGVKFSGVTWTPPRREMIDPVKETAATIEAIRGGLISWQEAVRELGYDADVLLAQIAEDNKKFDLNKIILDSDARQPKVAPAGTAPPAAD